MEIFKEFVLSVNQQEDTIIINEAEDSAEYSSQTSFSLYDFRHDRPYPTLPSISLKDKLSDRGSEMKYTIIDIGGGMRDAFGAGVLDYLMDEKIYIEDCIGVSAGASNLSNYISKQRGRVLRFYDTYPNRKEYMGLGQFIRHGSFLNMKYIYEEISFPDREDPFDIASYEASSHSFTIVATNALTGKPVYFPKDSIGPYNMLAMEASGTIPVLCRPTMLDGVPYYDGGISDPIPYRKALENGAERIILIITKRKDDFRDPEKDRRAVRILSRKYPEAARTLAKRAETYNSELKAVLELEKEGRAIVIAPDDTCGITTTKHRDEDIDRLYRKGYESGKAIKDFMA